VTLLNDDSEFPEFMDHLQAECDRRHWRYVEFRPLSGTQERDYGLQPSSSYWVHKLDTKPCLEQIVRELHKNSFQRKIRRAHTERLSYEVGTSQQLVDEFYRLVLITRRRHQLLPQPRRWFKNLVACMGGRTMFPSQQCSLCDIAHALYTSMGARTIASTTWAVCRSSSGNLSRTAKHRG